MIESTSTVPLVELNDVGRSFWEGGQERVVLAAVHLRICRGEWISLLGRSGSGKSTVLNLISGIDLPDRGKVIIAGTPLNDLTERQRTLFRREHIGFVFQFYNLIPSLTILENILLPLELTGSLTREGRTAARDLLAEIGLSDRANSYPDYLSGGEQQRVAVVRALAHRPMLLLADEPTGNLDAESGLQVLDLFTRLVRQTDTTMILVTHSAEVAQLADRIMTIKEGRLMATSLGGEAS